MRHIIGFEDFVVTKSTGEVPNPSRLLLEAAERDCRKHLLPVPMEGALPDLMQVFSFQLADVLGEIDPVWDRVLAFGQGGVQHIRPQLETHFKNSFAWNGDARSLPGWQGDIELNPELTSAACEQVQGETGQKLLISRDAGAFYCNWLAGALTRHMEIPGAALFVHLPYFSDVEMADRLWAVAGEILQRDYRIETREQLRHLTTEKSLQILKALQGFQDSL